MQVSPSALADSCSADARWVCSCARGQQHSRAGGLASGLVDNDETARRAVLVVVVKHQWGSGVQSDAANFVHLQTSYIGLTVQVGDN